MHKKKAGDADTPPLKRTTKNIRTGIHYLPDSFNCQIEYHKDGAALVAKKKIKRQNKTWGKRGKIKGWSKSSRARMRDFMLTHEPASDNWHTFGLTLTVPGSVLTESEAKQVWDEYTYKLNRIQVGMVWRKEIQARGQLHWHCVAIKPTVSRDLLKWTSMYDQYVEITKAWFESMDKLGVDDYECNIQYGNKIVTRQTGLRSSHIGALKNAVDVQEHKSNCAWLRYMQDHASKTKQEQIAESSGRHWGVINRKYFKKAEPNELQKLDSRIYCKFLRAYKRMCTTHIPDEKSPFGSRLGYTANYRWGRNVRFSNPETIKKLVTWATNDHPSPLPF